MRHLSIKIKGLTILLYTLHFTLYTVSYAAPCYGTTTPKKKEVFLGLQSHTVFKRYLEHEAGKLRSSQQFLLLSYGLYDWLSVDLKGGSGNIKQHPLGSDEIDYPTFLGGGYGFRLRLYEANNARMVFGFQHISIHPESMFIGARKHKGVLDDWQFSLLYSYAYKRITPYVGTRWSRLDYIHWIDGERDRVRSDLTKAIGLIYGFDLPLTEKTWLNLEGSAFDSESFAFSLNYRF